MQSINEMNNVATGQTWKTVFNCKGPSKPHKIIPGLYISNIKTAGAYALGQTPESFPRVSHIISILSDPSKKKDREMHRLPAFNLDNDPIDHLLIHESDVPSTNLVKHFDTTCAYIHTALCKLNTNTKEEENCGGVLVHCYAGISRSASIICAYLIKHRSDLFIPSPVLEPLKDLTNKTSSISLADENSAKSDEDLITAVSAIKYVRSKRKCVKPNEGFVRQLTFYCFVLKHRSVQPQTNIDLQAWTMWKESRNDHKEDKMFVGQEDGVCDGKPDDSSSLGDNTSQQT